MSCNLRDLALSQFNDPDDVWYADPPAGPTFVYPGDIERVWGEITPLNVLLDTAWTMWTPK